VVFEIDPEGCFDSLKSEMAESVVRQEEVTGWRGVLWLFKLGRVEELPALWFSALTAAMYTAWFFPGLSIILGSSSHAWYARHHYFFPTLGLALASFGSAIFLSSVVFRDGLAGSKNRKNFYFLVISGLCFALLGNVLAALKGEGAAFYCGVFIAVSCSRFLFEYHFPTFEILGHADFSRTGLWYFLSSVFLFQLACFWNPKTEGGWKYFLCFLMFQPVVVVPVLIVWRWQWHVSFLIPMTLFLVWWSWVSWRIFNHHDRAFVSLKVGRQVFDFLLMGSVGFAL